MENVANIHNDIGKIYHHTAKFLSKKDKTYYR